jgi:hypothetical protein
MKKMAILFALAGFLLGCSKSEDDVTPVNTNDLLGTWQMTTSKIAITAKDGQKVNDSRNGTSSNVMTFNSNGTLNDPSDLFNASIRSWKYSVSGNELTINTGANSDVGHFQLKINGTTMTWFMDRALADRSVKDSQGFTGVLNGDGDDLAQIASMEITIEFKKK